MAGAVMDFFTDKNVLITGATGFLGKILVEKLLRTQPGIRRIYVLLRAADADAARARFRNEVLRVDLFKPLKQQHGSDFESFVWERVVPLAGDIGSNSNLGIASESITTELFESLHIIFNNAATTTFDERYDVSLDVNTKGALHVVEFAKRCGKLKVLLHVSTAYVTGELSGIIRETALRQSSPISTNGNNSKPLIHDIMAEFQVLEKALASFDSSICDEKRKAKQLKALGLQRARKFGWPNTYTFTKAMGEMLVNESRANLPVVIIRPSIIESTLAEPFPGWMEGTRTIDTLIVAYGKGRLSSFLAHPDLFVDVIPADMVVNTVVVAAAKQAGSAGMAIYNVTTSMANPLFYKVATEAAFKYFLENPCKDKDGNAIIVQQPHFLQSMDSFRHFMLLRYKAPLEVIRVLNSVLCKIFAAKYSRMVRNYNYAMYLAELYEPYAFFRGRFDARNTERLQESLTAEEKRVFNLDVKCIDWFRYFYSIHFPGVVKHVLK